MTCLSQTNCVGASAKARAQASPLPTTSPRPRPSGRAVVGGSRAVNDPNAPADLGRVLSAREKGALARRRLDRAVDEFVSPVTNTVEAIDKQFIEPTGEALGGFRYHPDAPPAPPVRRGGGKGSKPATIAPSAADPVARFVNDRTQALPAGLRRYSGSELGAAVYEGRTVDGQRYFTNRPGENLDGKRRLNVDDTGTVGGPRMAPGGLFTAPTYERGSIVPPPDEVDGTFEFQLDRSAPAEGLAGRTYPEFAPDDVMPAITEEDLRGLSPMQRERFDEAQSEAARGAEYQNAPILAERDELMRETKRRRASFSPV